MTGTDPSDRSHEFEEIVRTELERREDITGFEIRDVDSAGVVVELEQEGTVETYLVTLEPHTDGSEETHWTYLGEKHEENR